MVSLILIRALYGQMFSHPIRSWKCSPGPFHLTPLNSFHCCPKLAPTPWHTPTFSLGTKSASSTRKCPFYRVAWSESRYRWYSAYVRKAWIYDSYRVEGKHFFLWNKYNHFSSISYSWAHILSILTRENRVPMNNSEKWIIIIATTTT